ncbi:hypothetical protein CG740_37015 [Streptomyces sp. CB01201]|nr:hypothetical protein CG740_37015 [Streptomyces sp. CB01201]
MGLLTVLRSETLPWYEALMVHLAVTDPPLGVEGTMAVQLPTLPADSDAEVSPCLSRRKFTVAPPVSVPMLVTTRDTGHPPLLTLLQGPSN